MGKTTTQEFAIGLPDPEKPLPIPANAWDLDRWAGGSTSGSATAVAAEMSLGAIGTDTAGSIRIPAAFNGISGLLPTAGAVPGAGIVPLAHSIDRPGPMARSAADCALLLAAIAQPAPSMPAGTEWSTDGLLGHLDADLTGVRIGVDDLDRYAAEGIDPAQPARFRAALHSWSRRAPISSRSSSRCTRRPSRSTSS